MKHYNIILNFLTEKHKQFNTHNINLQIRNAFNKGGLDEN